VSLVQDWLELSHIERQGTLTTEPIHLQELIESVWQTLDPLAHQKSVCFRYRQSGEFAQPLAVEGDNSRLYRVFLNLLDNAIRYSPPGGTIQVQAQRISRSQQGDRVQIQVIDEGSGFAVADLPHVFERLYRGDPGRGRNPEAHPATTAPTSTGSGLGLAIVKQIVLTHGGTIHADNSSKTGGACVTLELPAASFS
jgi:two-component system phosphate regulon sensor histidine kinase PhoR